MFDKILIARIGWGDLYQGEELVGNFSEPNESGSWWERFNFKPSIDAACYGYVPPMGSYQSPPRPRNHHGWLVIFVATEDGRGDGALLPVGWYEDATIEKDYKERPEKDLEQNYEYIFTTGTKSAYLIPKEKRSSFPTIPTEHFKRCFVYARAPFHREHWRKTYADLAEKIVARKRLCKRVG
jgi:hypothetical protein